MEKEDELLFSMNTRLTRVEAGQEKMLEKLVGIEKEMKEAPGNRRATILACFSVAVAVEKLLPLVFKAFGL